MAGSAVAVLVYAAANDNDTDTSGTVTGAPVDFGGSSIAGGTPCSEGLGTDIEV